MTAVRVDNIEYLQRTAAARSARTRQKAVDTLDRLQHDGTQVTVAGLARAAGVARSWIYTQPDLLARITTEHPRKRPAPIDRTGASDESWQRRIDLAHQRIKQPTEENRQLRAQLAVAHGQLRGTYVRFMESVAVAAANCPDVLHQAVAEALYLLNQDGDEPVDQCARQRGIILGPQQPDGTRTIRGRMTPNWAPPSARSSGNGVPPACATPTTKPRV